MGTGDVWIVRWMHYSSYDLRARLPNADNRGPNRAQSFNASICHSAPWVPPSPHCSYAALSSAVSTSKKWWEVTAKDSPVLSHSHEIESPCKRTCTHTEAAGEKYPQTCMCPCTSRHSNTRTGILDVQTMSVLQDILLTANCISNFRKRVSVYVSLEENVGQVTWKM